MSVTTPNGAVELHSGDRIAHWLIIDQLGSGGSASVYRAARDGNPGRAEDHVALRICRPTDRRHLDAIVSTYARMPEHPAVVQVLETFVHEANGHPHVVCVTELSDGGTLQQRLDQSVMQPDEARALSRQLVEGLDAFHTAGLVHGDVKPSNIMRFADTWKLVDPSATERSLRDATSSVVTHERTLRYVAPETLDTPGATRRTGDVWALGVTMHEALTGSPPFDSMADQVVANCRVASDVPDDLARLITDCVAPVESRAKTAGGLRDLQHSVAEGRSSVSRPVLALGAALAIGLVGILLFVVTRSTPPDIIDFESPTDIDRFVAADDTTPRPSLVTDDDSTRLVAGASSTNHIYYLDDRQRDGAVTLQADVRMTMYPSESYGVGGPVYGLLLKTIPSEANPVLDAYAVSVMPRSEGIRMRVGVLEQGAGSELYQYRSASEGHSDIADQILFAGVTEPGADAGPDENRDSLAVELGYWQLSASLVDTDSGVKIVAELKDPNGTSESVEWTDDGEKATAGPGSVGIATYGMWSIEPRIDNFVVGRDE